MNEVIINGKIVKKKEGYCIFLPRYSKEKNATIQVWNIPDDVRVGENITLIGHLAMKDVDGRHIFGVCVERIEYIQMDEKTTISGVVLKKGVLKKIRDRLFIHLVVKLDEETFVNVTFWENLAGYVKGNISPGDVVLATGRLFCRKYVDVVDGVARNKTTTQLNGLEIKKIECSE